MLYQLLLINISVSVTAIELLKFHDPEDVQ